MRQLPQTFTKYGYDFKLLKRTDKLALYEQRKANILQYELHIIKIQPEEINTGHFIIPAGEYLRSNEEFGLYAWSYQNIENVLTKFDLLSQIY